MISAESRNQSADRIANADPMFHYLFFRMKLTVFSKLVVKGTL